MNRVVYEHYDAPLLYADYDSDGAWLCLFIEENTYLCALLNSVQFEALQAGKMSFYEAFASQQFLNWVTHGQWDKVVKAEDVLHLLPDKDERVSQ